jgi:hypothetical protein
MRVQYIVDPHNQILERVRTAGPHRIDATDRNKKSLAYIDWSLQGVS